MPINCCKGCVPPKRNPYCHSTCQEYIAEKAEYERIRDEHNDKYKVERAIYLSRSDKVYKAMKDRRS